MSSPIRSANDDYSIVHIATHGHFDSNPEKSFLLVYDDKLTMNLLERASGSASYWVNLSNCWSSAPAKRQRATTVQSGGGNVTRSRHRK